MQNETRNGIVQIESKIVIGIRTIAQWVESSERLSIWLGFLIIELLIIVARLATGGGGHCRLIGLLSKGHDTVEYATGKTTGQAKDMGKGRTHAQA